MKCIICNGDDIHVTRVEEELKRGNDIVYVPIEVLVCSSCGERYYDRKTIRHLEEGELDLKSGEANLQEVGRVLVLNE